MMKCEKTDCIHFRDGECYKKMVRMSEDGCADYQQAKRIKHDEAVDDE